MTTIPRIFSAVFLVLISLLPVRAEIRTFEKLQKDQASRIVQLPDLENPTGIRVSDGRIFILEESSIAVYSAENFQLIKKFGRRGEGPGEFKYPPYLIPQAGHLLILNFDRYFLYSLEGELLEEKKMPLNYNYWFFPLLPVGDNYIGFPLEPVEGMGFGHIGLLYNQEFQKIKKVYDPFPSLIPPPSPPPRPGEKSRSFSKQDLEAIPDCIDVSVAGDKFFIADTRKGFYISVFDTQGNTLYDIDKDFKKIRVSKDRREAYMNELREQPNWKNLNSRYNYVFKDIFPAFFSFKISGQNIYCLTHAKKNNCYEIVVLDFEGKVQGQSFSFPLEPFQRLNETFVLYSSEFDIYSDKIFHLEYNYDLESIELHITDIK